MTRLVYDLPNKILYLSVSRANVCIFEKNFVQYIIRFLTFFIDGIFENQCLELS